MPNSILNSRNNFSSVAVSGQTTLTATGVSDTLTLAAGNNITITTNAGTNTATIATINAGDASGPASAADGQIALFNGTTGKLLKRNSALTGVPVLSSGVVATESPLTVNNGGTGVTGITGYSVVLAGTSASGPFQALASIGTSGQVLVSNGAGNKPTFQTRAAGSLVLISSQTASSSSSIDFTGLNSTYVNYCIVGINVLSSVDGDILAARIARSSGVWDSGATDYAFQVCSPTAISNTGSSYIGLVDTTAGIGNATAEGVSFVAYVYDTQNSSAVPRINCTTSHLATTSSSWSQPVTSVTTGVRRTQSVTEGVRFLFASGNIASGTFYLYGIKNS